MKTTILSLILLLASTCGKCATPWDSTPDFELFTCDGFVAVSVPACLEANGVKWSPGLLCWPAMTLGWDALYRAGENNPKSWNEFWTLDVPGNILGALIVSPLLHDLGVI